MQIWKAISASFILWKFLFRTIKERFWTGWVWKIRFLIKQILLWKMSPYRYTYVWCVFLSVRVIEEKWHSLKTKIMVWGSISSSFYPNWSIILREEKILSWYSLTRFVWNKSIEKHVLLGYLNSPDLYRLLSRSWPYLLVCTPWSGCQWWGSCTAGTPPHTGSRTGCSGRCTPPRHCTWCNSRQIGQTSLVNTEGRWSGDLA